MSCSVALSALGSMPHPAPLTNINLGRNRHESDPQLRGAEKGAGRANGKHASASTRTTQLSLHIELPIPKLLG
jgi:hypothetical protein